MNEERRFEEAYVSGLYTVWAMYQADEFYVEEIENCSDWIASHKWSENSQECKDFKRGFHDAVNGIYDVHAYEDEWAKMKHMVNAIWGVDIDKLSLVVVRGGANSMSFPVASNDEVYFPEAFLSKYNLPDHSKVRFCSELVELDRWLIPWKVKAGYSERLNLLVYRVEQ